MLELNGFELSSFAINTPNDCSLILTTEEHEEVIDRILSELVNLGVTEVRYYAEFIINVDRDLSMTMEKQYCLVVEGLKRILKL